MQNKNTKTVCLISLQYHGSLECHFNFRRNLLPYNARHGDVVIIERNNKFGVNCKLAVFTGDPAFYDSRLLLSVYLKITFRAYFIDPILGKIDLLDNLS
jgi:hypothetical protein